MKRRMLAAWLALCLAAALLPAGALAAEKPLTVPTLPGHTITITADHGAVTAQPKRAEAGETVTLTIIPEEGYETETVAVTSVTGETVAVTGCRFTMPAASVRVKVTFVRTASRLPFADVTEEDWFYDEVLWAWEKGVMDGVGNGRFDPGGSVTRAMVWAVLARMDGRSISGPDWMAQARAWAVAAGVSDGTMAAGSVTREQLSTMLWRYAGEPVVSGSLTGYPDRDQASPWAVEALVWAARKGVVEGMDGMLYPRGGAPRCQLAAILARFSGKGVLQNAAPLQSVEKGEAPFSTD